jgi:hypothetical protein
MSDEGRRWPWQDRYDRSVTPGWALGFVVGGLMLFGLIVYWINDMHMYGYGPWGG